MVEPGSDPPLLSAQIVFQAPSLKEAKDVAEENLKEFLDYLTFATGSKFRPCRIFQVFNWEPGEGMRESIQYAGFSDPDVPLPALDAEILQTVANLQEHVIDTRIRRALKWFANGVATFYLDDQFTFFWLVIELVAQIVKEPTRVPDKCPQCQTPLFCPTCNQTPLHRPYPKQSIQQLFAKYVENGEKIYELASEARNRLFHGDEITDIEASLEVDFAELVDKLGAIAWTAIFNQFTRGLVGKRPMFLQPNRYAHMKVTMGAHITFGFEPNFDDPHPDHFPKISVTMISRGEGEEEIEHAPIGSRQDKSQQISRKGTTRSRDGSGEGA